MAAPITSAVADTKATGEIAVGPLFSQSDKTPSDKSIEKDHAKILQTSDFDHSSDPDHTIGLPKYHGTFDEADDKTFYAPIERYEGKHRYDPEFEWEPKEEKRLVRKV